MATKPPAPENGHPTSLMAVVYGIPGALGVQPANGRDYAVSFGLHGHDQRYRITLARGRLTLQVDDDLKTALPPDLVGAVRTAFEPRVGTIEPDYDSSTLTVPRVDEGLLARMNIRIPPPYTQVSYAHP